MFAFYALPWLFAAFYALCARTVGKKGADPVRRTGSGRTRQSSSRAHLRYCDGLHNAFDRVTYDLYLPTVRFRSALALQALDARTTTRYN